MYPSSSNCDPFPSTNQTMLGSYSSSAQVQEQHSSLFLHFPEPFLADDDNELLMTHFLSQHQILGSSTNQVAAEAENKTASPNEATKRTTKKKKSESNGEKQSIPKKKTGKKDRHSKIYTAQGPRDRRMRLSLQIARKFFDLQDMLGFDKASKTIEWLFSKSKAAIKEITESLPSVKHSCSGGGKSLSSTSESEVVSGIFKATEDNRDLKGALAIGESSVGTTRGAPNRKSRKATTNPLVRESREKARARARERTLEKRKIKDLEIAKQCSDEANPNDLELLGSPSALQIADNLGSCSQEMNSSLKVATEDQEEPSSTVHFPENQMDSVSIIEKFLGITSSPRSSSIFNYSLNIAESSGANFHQNNLVFPGNWDGTESDNRIHYSYSSLTNTKEPTGNLLVQNPNAIFIINPNSQEQKSNSTFMTPANAGMQNPSSVFMAPSITHEQNPSSILITTSNINSQSLYLEDQFSCNPIAPNKYSSLY
ncbi:hypothetical protein ACOSQ4_017905 [Xanthoceras sorbifolium]